MFLNTLNSFPAGVIWVSPVPGLRRGDGDDGDVEGQRQAGQFKVHPCYSNSTRSWHEYRETYKGTQTPLEMASLAEHSQMTELPSRRRYVTVSTGLLHSSESGFGFILDLPHVCIVYCILF